MGDDNQTTTPVEPGMEETPVTPEEMPVEAPAESAAEEGEAAA